MYVGASQEGVSSDRKCTSAFEVPYVSLGMVRYLYRAFFSCMVRYGKVTVQGIHVVYGTVRYGTVCFGKVTVQSIHVRYGTVW